MRAPAALIWLLGSARIALALLASSASPAATGALLGLASTLLAAVLGAWALGGARLLASSRLAARLDPFVTLLASVAAVLVVVGLLIAAGTTSGAGGTFAVFGVMKRPELDLRAVGVLFLVAAAAYVLSKPALRLPWYLAIAAALLPLGLTLRAATAELDRRTGLGVERSGALSKMSLGLARRMTDRDRDGHSGRFGGADCNDRDAKISPDADDVPGNGVDEDCSGKDDAPVRVDRAAPAAADLAGTIKQRLPEKPNLVLLTIDTLRYDLGYMGYSRPVSPNLDALAKRAVVFERAYALASYTSKSLPPMLIGKYPSETHRGWAHFNRFGKQDTFIQERLKASGVRTISVQGYWYFFNPGYGFERGFDVIDSSAAPAVAQVEGDRSFNGHKVADAAIAQLSKPENTGGQFFLWAHWVDPHSEYAKHEDFDFGSSSRERYDGEVAFVDHHVGRVLDFIQQSAFAARTAVIVTSDHGEAFGEHGMIRHGFELWEELVRVPLIVHVPGVPARRVSVRRGAIDIAPTILELFGLPRPDAGKDFMSGQSLLPDLMLPADRKPEARTVFVDMAAGPHNAERQAFIEGDLKLVASGGRPLGLYDLAKDPAEKQDLLDDAALKADVLGRFKAFRRELREVVVRPE